MGTYSESLASRAAAAVIQRRDGTHSNDLVIIKLVQNVLD